MLYPKFYVHKSEPSLEEAQKFVGGLVELLELPNGDCLLVNQESALYNNSIVNAKASILADMMILGNAIQLKKKNRKNW